MGGSTVDYKTIVEKAVREMNQQDVQHFLVVCALASDLYCPVTTLTSHSRKTRTCRGPPTRYKIDTAKLSATVREELSKSEKKTTPNKDKTTKRKLK